MNIEEIRNYCNSLKGIPEDIKWGSDLCFCIDGKMFCVVPLEGKLRVTFKVTPEEFDALIDAEGFIPASYLARAKWVTLIEVSKINDNVLMAYIYRSYELIKLKLPKKYLK
jgi:predicted DNA-binding protein (MmcQ/YjbR family)